MITDERKEELELMWLGITIGEFENEPKFSYSQLNDEEKDYVDKLESQFIKKLIKFSEGI